MPKILSVESRNRRTRNNENIFQRVGDWFSSQNKFVQSTLVIMFLILICTPLFTNQKILFTIFGHASSTITTQLIDNFDQDTTAVSGWALSTWPTGPTGTLTIGQGANYSNNTGDKAANINFTYQSSAAGYQEVAMNYSFASIQPQAAELGFWAKSPGGVKVIVYIFDNSGQRLEYDTERPLEATNPGVWYQKVIKLDEPSHYTGGLNNGIVQYPITKITIAAQDLVSQYSGSNNAFIGSGTVAIDNVQWMDVNTTTATRTVDPQDPAIVPSTTTGNNPLQNIGTLIHATLSTTTLSELQQTKVGLNREDLVWEKVETSPSVYNWSSYDSYLSQMQSIGTKVLFILDYGNSLYMPYQTSSGQDYGDTTAVTQYANFAKAAAQHFQSNSSFAGFEIWNEPDNLGFWYPGPNASQYAQLESSAVTAIHSVNPSIPVTVAGFGPDYNFLHSYIGAIQGLGGEHANALAIHPYRQDIPETVSDDVLYYRSYITQLGLNAQLWITEWGYPIDSTWWNFGADPVYIASQANTVSALQAKMIVRQLWTSIALGIVYMDQYELRDVGDTFGLRDNLDNPKPSWSSFTTATKFMQQFPTFVGIEPMQLTNLHTLVLKNSSQYLLVLWKDGATSQVLDNIPSTYTIQSVTDYMGNSVPVSGNAIWVNDTPVYVVVNNPNAPTPTPTTAPLPTATPMITPTPTQTPAVVDTAPPTVSLTFPINGTTVARRATVTLTASAADDTKVSQVLFLINGSTVCTDTTTPYTCNWSVPGKPGASYTITAKAIDAANYYTISSPVNVTAK